MTCPKCNGKTKVIESTIDDDSITRRRACAECGYRFNTVEIDKDLYERLSKRSEHLAHWIDIGDNNCKCSACDNIRYGNSKQAVDKYNLAPYCEKCGTRMIK